MRETEEKPGRAQDEPIIRYELGRAYDEEYPRRENERAMPDYTIRDTYLTSDIDLAIPGYVMWNFERNPEKRE